MKSLKLLSRQILILLIILSSCNQPSNEEPEEKVSPKFLSISDIHFDPFYDTTLVKDLITTNYSNWDNVFKKSEIKNFGKYGHDSNYKLFKSSLIKLKAVNNKPDFITISGDFLAHSFEKNFQNYSGNTNEKDLQEFIIKTMNYIAFSLESTFPETVIYPSLGNNDSFCGDYQVQSNGKFLKEIVDIWKPFLKSTIDNKEFKATFSKGGYYSAVTPQNKKHRIIALNTIEFSIKYQSEYIGNFCNMIPDSTANIKAAMNQLNWLEDQLKGAKLNNEKVWLIYHIPPGINAYSTLKATGSCDEKIKTYWKTAFKSEFEKIINKYSEVINANLAGHSHMDNFIVINKNAEPSTFIHITPAISPIFGNNPGFIEYEYDIQKSSLVNYKTFYFKDLETSKKENWQFEYQYSTVYKQQEINAVTLAAIHSKFESDSTMRQHFIDYYIVEDLADSGINKQNWKTYWCSMASIKNEDFCECVGSEDL